MPPPQDPTEATPLLSPPDHNHDSTDHQHHHQDQQISEAQPDNEKTSKFALFFSSLREYVTLSDEKRLLLAGFLITLSFSFTQVPIFFAFYIMECDVFYSKHPPFEGPGDRCARNEIAAGTSTQFSIMAMSTTLCGTLNLFVAGWMAKRIGPRGALMVQTFVPALRVACQIVGVVTGGRMGIVIFQVTQVVTVLGGPAGYVLIANIIAGEVAEPLRRTALFGMLQGCIMLGQGTGFLSGGMIGDVWGITRPFEVAFVSFLISTVFVRVALPYISADALVDDKKPGGGGQRGLSEMFSPLRLLAVQRVRFPDGRVRKHYGVVFLALGVFMGVLATGYAPLLIQLYATAKFQFQQGDNGWLMSGFFFARAFFLVVLFPRITTLGRKWYLARYQTGSDNPTTPTQEEDDSESAIEPLIPEGSHKKPDGIAFDLLFLRGSLVVDGALTMCAAFAAQKWHIYLAALLLPFASGTAPAAKGVMTEMCRPSQRADALNALTLVENVATLATQGLFGFIFSALAEVGRPHLTFFVNAALALCAVGVLSLSHFAPPGSAIVEEGEGEVEDVEGVEGR